MPVKEQCQECNGHGKVEYCVNPDNGHLDTQAHNLRYEKFKCRACDGTGEVALTAV